MGNQQVESIKKGREGEKEGGCDSVVCTCMCVCADASSHACTPVYKTIGGRKSSQRLRGPHVEKESITVYDHRLCFFLHWFCTHL